MLNNHIRRPRQSSGAALMALSIVLAVLSAVRAESNPIALMLSTARSFVERKTVYDPSYQTLAYPGGDPGEGIGVCTDLVVRAYRAVGSDLQVLVHDDMRKNFSAYPAQKLYGQTKPDPNIDHRRVPNLKAFFARNGQTLTTSLEPDQLPEWKPGDIVIFDLYGNGAPTHIGLISDRKTDSGRPLALHHYPPYPTEEDCLGTWKIIAHYRYPGEIQN